MSCRLIITENPLEPEKSTVYEDCYFPRETLQAHFPNGWPDGARIYQDHVSQLTDITPYDDETVAALDKLEGDVYVIVYPEGPILLIALVVVALVAVTVLLKPKIPDVAADAAQNRQDSSPNNELSARTNKPRLMARIPDIYGTVRSTPDMIMQTYNYYENNKKVEIGYMCVGRGEYEIHDVQDGDTPLQRIAGSSAQFYGPNTSPNSGHAPSHAVGSFIDDLLYRAKKLEQVVGQELRAPNSASATGSNNIKFSFPDTISNNVGINFQDKFLDGDQVSITGATFSGATDPISVNATARYVHSVPYPYVEWQSGDPTGSFVVGDSLQVSNSATTGVLDTFTTTFTGTAKFTDTGRIDFDTRGSHPIEDGQDFRTGQSITVSGASFSYNFAGTYTVASKTTTKLLLSDWNTVAPAAWAAINGSTGYQSMSIGGITRTARFNAADHSIELQSGNFDDITLPATVVVSGSGSTFTTNLNGTYTLSSYNNGSNYWTLSSPSGVNSDWNKINGSTADVSVTITQTHAGDTQSVDFNGTYTIAALSSSRIYLSNPSAVNSAWSSLPGFVNDRTEYPGSTDTFYVGAPTRTVNLNGTYTVVSVGLYNVTLSNPALINSDWNKLQYFAGDAVTPVAPTIATTGGNWIGPYLIDNPNTARIISNFQCPNGLYTDDGKNQARKQVEVEMLIYPADENGNATGAAPYNPHLILTGSAVQRDIIAASINYGIGSHSRFLIYARRMTAKDTAFQGQVVDTVKWEDVFYLEQETKTHFGDITTVYTKTYATGGALALKERKLNCRVTRKIPYITGFTGVYPNMTPVYAADKVATRSAWQIFCAIATDPKFGSRQSSEIDFYGIATASNDVYEYFGNSQECTEFSYTFDNTNISFEEAAQAIANVCFCTAYRQGSLIKWKPETSQGDPVLLFNHRNKLPDTETRTIRFGAQNDYDSIELEWTNPIDDSIETFFIPEDQSGISPKKIETIGIRNITQATFHAYRSFYKMRFQNTAVEFDATQEAAILVTKDKVLVADNTRADTQDGEIWDQEVLQLTLSQPVKFIAGKNYTMFIQHIDGSVEGIPCTPVADNLFLVRTVYIRQEGGVRFPTPADAGNLTVGDKVALAATSYNDPVNGNLNFDNQNGTTYTVASVDGTTGIVLFDNPASVDADWGRITETEHSRVGVNFTCNRDAKRKVNLAYAPRAPLSLDPANYARATYVLRANTEAAPALFQVQETTPKDNFTYRCSLINYDSRVYYLDDLEFWMNFDDQTIRDASARSHVVYTSSASNKAHTGYDSIRDGYVFSNDANASAAWVKCDDLMSHLGSYTKAFWIRQAGGFDAYVLSNAYEQFRVNQANRIIATHVGGGNFTSVTWPTIADAWHHACVTYDANTLIMCLYVDGQKVAQRTAYPLPTATAALQPIGLNTSGVAYRALDDIRYWRKAFTEQQVIELYNATR